MEMTMLILGLENILLRFDESSRISRDDPWQIMPIWTDNQNVDRKVKQLFDKGEERF